MPNIEYRSSCTAPRKGHKGPTMRTRYDQEALVAQAQQGFEQLETFVVEGAAGQELHEVEAEVYRRLLALGQVLLRPFVAARGTGYDPDEPLATLDGRALTYKGLQHVEYLSVFGSIELTRAAYALPDGGYVYPMDEQWNRPAQKYSYLLQKWLQAVASESDYREAVDRLQELLGLGLVPNAPHRLTQAVAAQVDSYYEEADLPPADSEGSHVLISADGKGVRILGARDVEDGQQARPRRSKGEKQGTRKEAVVTVEATFDPEARDGEERVGTIMRGRTAVERERRRQARRRRPVARHGIPVGGRHGTAWREGRETHRLGGRQSAVSASGGCRSRPRGSPADADQRPDHGRSGRSADQDDHLLRKPSAHDGLRRVPGQRVSGRHGAG